MEFIKMLKKTCWTQFFDIFDCSNNMLIINVLYKNLLFFPSNITLKSLTFKFLFRHFSKAII